MKKLLVMPLLVAIIFYFGNYFASIQVQAEIEQPQAKENTTEIYGKIKEANGNEIVIAVGSMASEGRGSMNAGAADNAAPDGSVFGGIPRGESPSRERGEWPSDMMSGNRQRQEGRTSNDLENGGGFGERAPNTAEGQIGQNIGERQTSRGNQSVSGQGGGMSALAGMAANSSSLALTGEEKTFLIPVTAKITAGSGESERTVRFTQLAYKNTVRLTLSENGSVIAVNVLS